MAHTNSTMHWTNIQQCPNPTRRNILWYGTGALWDLWEHPMPNYETSQGVIAGSKTHGPLARRLKLRVAHVPGMFSPPSRVSDPGMQHGMCVTHVPWCMPGSLTTGSFWSRWRGKHSRSMRNSQFYVTGKRPMRNWIQMSFRLPKFRSVIYPLRTYFV